MDFRLSTFENVLYYNPLHLLSLETTIIRPADTVHISTHATFLIPPPKYRPFAHPSDTLACDPCNATTRPETNDYTIHTLYHATLSYCNMTNTNYPLSAIITDCSHRPEVTSG